MGEFRKLTIELDAEAADDVARAVADGEYANVEQVVAQAVALWRRDRETERLKVAFAEGLASGEPVDGSFDAEEVKQRGRERLAARRA